MIRRASVCFPDDPDIVGAKVNRFGFVGRSFEQSVHIFAPGLKSSRNHKALLSAKLNQVRLDGEPHNPSGLALAVGVVNARDELTNPLTRQPRELNLRHSCGDQPGAVDSLFRRFAVEVLVVGLRVGAGMVDDAVPMIRGRIERIELQWNTAGIDDVVIHPSRDDYREARSDRRPNAIENRLTGTLLHAKELVELVDFRPDLFLGL